MMLHRLGGGIRRNGLRLLIVLLFCRRRRSGALLEGTAHLSTCFNKATSAFAPQLKPRNMMLLSCAAPLQRGA